MVTNDTAEGFVKVVGNGIAFTCAGATERKAVGNAVNEQAP